MVNTAIAAGLLSLEIGVDRHLGDAASTDGIDVIDGGGAALRTDGLDSLLRDFELHERPQPAAPIAHSQSLLDGRLRRGFVPVAFGS